MGVQFSSRARTFSLVVTLRWPRHQVEPATTDGLARPGEAQYGPSSALGGGPQQVEGSGDGVEALNFGGQGFLHGLGLVLREDDDHESAPRVIPGQVTQGQHARFGPALEPNPRPNAGADPDPA